jgi:hypothetical protein
MTCLEAAVAILKSADRPMTIEEITGEALRRRLIQRLSKTPDASMSAALYVPAREARRARVRRVYQPAKQRAKRGPSCSEAG